MISRIAGFLALGSLLLLPGSALAASPIYTPPIKFYYGLQSYHCTAVNTGTKDVEAVTVEIVRTTLGYAGTVIATNVAESAAPGQAVGIVLNDLTGGPGAICRVTGISKKSVQVTFQAWDSNGEAFTVTAP